MKRKKWRVAGINFEHFHMGDLLKMAAEHPQVEVVGVCDEQSSRMKEVIGRLGLPASAVFNDPDACIETTKPDIVLLCPAAAGHEVWVRKVAPHNVHILVEKPFATRLKEADAMIRAMPKDRTLMINWPLQWVASHKKAYDLIEAGVIGDVTNVWHFGGNRGPLWHGAEKQERTAEQVKKEKSTSWFYKKEHGGGSLLDYLGYGSTLGTWYQGGRRPLDVLAVTDDNGELEVDEHSIVIARYAHGLSKFETRWGTFTDPWNIQPQPTCGFVIAGTEGTISTNDYDPHVTVQTRKRPQPHRVKAPELRGRHKDPIHCLVHTLNTGDPLTGPVSLPISRLGQEIVDAAVRSVQTGRAVRLAKAP